MEHFTGKQVGDWIGSRKTILLVDDEKAIRFMAKMFLEANGYDVLEAANGSEVRAIWKTKMSKIDLLVADFVLPGGITGLRLAQQLQIDRPSLKVIITSGHGRDDEPLLASINFLPKPYRLGDLAEIIQQSLLEGQAA